MSTKGKAKVTKKIDTNQNWISKWLFRLGVLSLVYATFSYLDTIKVCSVRHFVSIGSNLLLSQHRWYVFDPKELHELAQAAVKAHGNDTREMISYIVANLTAEYPVESRKISLNPRQDEWVFSNAGGAMGAMYIIHASITEYLIIFGTPLGTEGHTGLHTADDYFNILHGEQWAFLPGALEMEAYKPGDVHHLPRGTAKQYKMHKGCFALEYARGTLPAYM